MSQNFEPPRSSPHPGVDRVDVHVYLINGDLWPHEGHFAAQLLQRYQELVARGDMEGWQIIEEMLGDDWGAPPKYVQILVNGTGVVSIPYDKPKRSRR